MSAGRVDVVIPTYNGARLLPATLDSILAQTYPDVTVTVVDDGSTDRTRDVVCRYGGRVHYLFKENGGQASARNLGCRSGNGEFVFFVDSDDLLLPGAVEALTTHLISDERAELCYGKVLAFDSPDAAHPYAECWRAFVEWPRMIEPLTALCAIHGSAALIRRRAFVRYGFLPEERRFQGCEDWHFWLTLVLGGAGIVYVPQTLALYRQHGAASSASERGVAVREMNLVRAMATMFDVHGVNDARSREFLALGILAISLRWIALGDLPMFVELAELAKRVASTGLRARELVASVDLGDVRSTACTWLRMTEAYLDLGARELAAIAFGRVPADLADGPLKRPMERVFQAMDALVQGELARAAHEPSYLGHTARQLARVCNVSRDTQGRETYIRHARTLNPNDLRNDLYLAGVLAVRGAYPEAAAIVQQALAERPAGVVKAGARGVKRKLRNLLR